MPTPYIEELATKHGKSVEEVEKLWNKAKSLAAKEGKEENYGYITGILKRMMGESVETKEEDMTTTLDEKRIKTDDEYAEEQAAKQKEIAKRETRRATAMRKRDTSMRESIDNFVQASLNGDKETAQAHLAQILMDKVSDRLEELRYDVAQAHFGLEEATLSAKAGAAGKDLGKPGKGFEKIERSASERYGAGHGAKIAGAVLAKMRAKAAK